MARVRLEGVRFDADAVLGLDTNLTAAAKATRLFAGHLVVADYIPWDDATLVPYDWGYFAFVHNVDAAVPANFKDLAASDVKIVIQDPRSSTPGLGLLLWVKAACGDEAPAIWADLSDNIVTVTKGWSEAAAMFDEGHYMQVEVAGRLATSDQPELADQFPSFMVSEAFQSIIPTTIWMYPAVTSAAGLPAGFETLVQPGKSLLLSEDEAASVRDAALDEWLTALSQ